MTPWNATDATTEADRPLSPLERWYWICDQISPLNVISHARLHGPFDAGLAARALAALQSRHPLLRSAITADAQGRKPRFRPAPGREVPLRTVTAPAGPDGGGDGAEAWEREVNTYELVTAVNWRTGPLARALVVTRPGGDGVPDVHDLVLTVPHCIADGTTVLTLMRQWVELAGELAAHESRSAERAPRTGSLRVLPAPEQLLPAGHRGLAGLRKVVGQQIADQGTARRIKPRRFEPTSRVPFESRVTQLLGRSLPADELAELVAACKREQATVHGALAAAMATAAAQDAGDRPGPLVIGSPITFRDALVPRVTEDEIGTYVATVPSIVDYRPGAPLWPMARTISRDLARRRRRGEHLTAVATLGPVAPKSVAKSERFLRFMEEKGPITLCVSNVGRYDFPDTVGPWRVTSAEFVAGLSVNASYCAAITTAHGRLAWNFTHVEGAVPANRAERLAAASLEAVRDAVKQS
ncbi:MULTISPECIES: short-chain dehydrogenase [unclassified Streptomyces]|uniref:phthiocerol/phthiodiolone dimycocerosyl transferase family protein n=1 Tax=unclassified Streptomyces TaxID=2593676 RepID=UPI0033A2B3A1